MTRDWEESFSAVRFRRRMRAYSNHETGPMRDTNSAAGHAYTCRSNPRDQQRTKAAKIRNPFIWLRDGRAPVAGLLRVARSSE